VEKSEKKAGKNISQKVSFSLSNLDFSLAVVKQISGFVDTCFSPFCTFFSASSSLSFSVCVLSFSVSAFSFTSLTSVYFLLISLRKQGDASPSCTLSTTKCVVLSPSSSLL
jgi:hypothetical protein